MYALLFGKSRAGKEHDILVLRQDYPAIESYARNEVEDFLKMYFILNSLSMNSFGSDDQVILFPCLLATNRF